MIFNNRVLLIMNKAPEGWKQKLTLKQFDKLVKDNKKYYKPLFAIYRTKKIRDYDPETGAYAGWKSVQIGVGEPIGYEYVGYFEAKLIDNLLKSNILMSRILASHD